ncbi:MAG: Pyruvate synthase subunit PorB [Methanonatronarchaeales archaeon]|nr:Pyruvate synthase subunit PorB [Methanonatronarchaeales archaeon]
MLAPGHNACPGCGATLIARYALKATGPDVVVTLPTGCLEVTTSPYPNSSWRVPWIHSLFENSAAVASGVEAALKAQGRDEKVLAMGGDGGTVDIGMQAISGMLERGQDVTYVCYDNEAYMNTGVQRSGSTPLDASTTTSPSGSCSFGNPVKKKDMPAIVAAHGIPYVATANVAYPKDCIGKMEAAVETEGPAYVQVLSPCPPGWSMEDSRMVEVGKLAVQTGLWVNFEKRGDGVVYTKVPERQVRPVEDYLKPQGRFKHLFGGEGGEEELARIQAVADRNLENHDIVR